MKVLQYNRAGTPDSGSDRPPPLPPRHKNVVIAVIGPTGVGKSSFIKTLTGNEDIVIGHGLTSGEPWP
jgi:putative ribosome biogenesis GTPase RsgA